MAKEDTLIYLNRLINNIDPGKDFLQGGTTAKYSSFLKEQIIAPIFNLSALEKRDIDKVVGVGDNKDYLKKMITSTIRLNDFEQQIIRIKSGGGADLRLEGYNVAHDAGTGPDKLCKDSNALVITPGSVLDPGPRDKTPTSNGNGLSKPSTITPDILKQIGLDSALKSVEFLGLTGGNYHFRFKTTVVGFTTVEVGFDKGHVEKYVKNIDGEEFPADYKLFAGNPFKSRFIEKNFNNGNPTPRNRGLMQLLTLMKELGDTLQVIWLKKLIEPLHFEANKTVILTGDTVVWLRAILNGVSCVFTNSGVSTLYLVAADKLTEAVRQNQIKDTIVKSFETKNNGVIQSLKAFLNRLDFGYKFQGKPLNEDAIKDLVIIVKSVIKYIEPISSDILKAVKRMPGGDLKAVRDYIEKNTLKQPFEVDDRNGEFNLYSGFKWFFHAKRELRFNPDQIIPGLRNKKINVKQVLGDIPLAATSGGSIQRSSSRPRSLKSRSTERQSHKNTGPLSKKEDFITCLKNNMKSPGFMAYFVLTYLLELLFIGYSYAKAIDYPNYEKFEALFANDNAVFIGEHFGKLYDLTFETYETTDAERIRKYSELIMELLYIISVSVSKIQAGMTLYDMVYDDTRWFCQFVQDGLKGNPKLNEIADLFDKTENAHWGAMDVYQDLFDAEFALTILNERDKKTPQQYAKEYAPSMESVQKVQEATMQVEKTLSPERGEVYETPPTATPPTATPPTATPPTATPRSHLRHGTPQQSREKSMSKRKASLGTFTQSRKIGKSISQAKRNLSMSQRPFSRSKTLRKSSKSGSRAHHMNTIMENAQWA